MLSFLRRHETPPDTTSFLEHPAGALPSEPATSNLRLARIGHHRYELRRDPRRGTWSVWYRRAAVRVGPTVGTLTAAEGVAGRHLADLERRERET